MHSLPSRRRLPQPNFFRFKCHRLSPLPVPRPPPSVPAPAPPLTGQLPAACLPVITPPLVSANKHTLANPLTPAAVCREAQRPPTHCSQTRPRTPGTVRQADTRLDDGAVGRQGRRTFSQSANRDSVIAPARSHPRHPVHLHSQEDHLPRLPSFSHSGWCGDEGVVVSPAATRLTPE